MLPPFRTASAVLCAFVLLTGSHEAHGQGWVLDASAGQIAHEALPGSIGTFGATLGVRYEGARWLALSAGIPFDSAGVPWGALGAGARLASSGPVVVGIDVGAHAYGFQDPISRANGGGATVEAMPLLSMRAGPVGLGVRSGLLHYTSVFSGESTSRSVHASDARLSFGSAVFRVTGEGRFIRAEEGSYPYAGASAEASLGGGTLWGYGGKWIADVIKTPVWGGGARLTILGRTDVYASFQQETNDPLYWNTPRRSWSVGVSRRLGRPPHSLPALIPRSLAPEVSAGQVTFRMPLSASSESPALGGDFTQWKPVRMIRDREFWTLTLPVRRGSHRYAFRRGDGEWFVPESVPGRMDDGMGGTVAVLIVP